MNNLTDKCKKRDDFRGIILVPKIDVDLDKNTIYTDKDAIDPALVRHALLYFDKIEVPENNLARITYPEISELEKEGFAQRTYVRCTEKIYGGRLLLESQALVFRKLMEEEPGFWTMGQVGRKFLLSGNAEDRKKIVDFKINDALPMPPAQIALGEVIRFRQDRDAEFIAFRFAVDALYDEVLKSSRLPAAENQVLQKLRETINDIQRVSNEKWKARIRSSVKFSFSAENIDFDTALGAMARATLGSAAGLGLVSKFSLPDQLNIPMQVLGGAVGIIKPWISINLKNALRPASLPPEAAPFSYLLEAGKAMPGLLPKP